MLDEDFSTPTHDDASLKGKPARAPFGYYGAKLRIASQIIKTLPPHNAWVEAFCGSAALTLAKKPVPIEIINDIDGQVINLFEQLRKDSAALCRVIALTPYSRQEFETARKGLKSDDPLESARRFLISTMMTVNGTIGDQNRCGFSFSDSYSRGGREARVNRWYNLPERLEKVVERLRGIRVEKRDARDLLKMFVDRPATLVYLDPPYYVQRDHQYVIDANDRGFHTELLQLCMSAQCMILLSGYENELYTELLRPEDGWTHRVIETHTRNTTGEDRVRKEILWMNWAFTEAKAAGAVPVTLTEAEKMEHKINPVRRRSSPPA